MITDISLDGLNGTRSQEGRALRAYQDTTGVWTLGYGLTNYDKGLPWKIGPGITCTAEQAEWFLYKSLRDHYVPDVLKVIDQTRVPHAKGAIDGGADMHYNTGGILRSSWPKFLNEGNLAAAKANLESWNRAGGRVLGDLVRRRAWEWGVISAENYGIETGPANVTVNAVGREIGERGTGGLLTAYPTDPGIVTLTPTTVRQDGIPDKDSALPPPGSVLKPGSTGPEVIEAQDQLTAAGFPTPPTGTYDGVTANNVVKFQQAHPQLTADGEVGPATSAALARAGDLRAKAGNIGKAAASVPVASAAAWKGLSAHIGEIALIVGGVFLVVAVGILVWRYRHDIVAMGNKALGRVVV